MRAEADDGILAVHRLNERLKRALEICHRDALVDHQTLDLVEHRRVRRVDLVLAVDSAGGKDADGRLFDLVHCADLHGAGLRAQQDLFVFCNIERIAAVARGVVFRDIQAREVIVGKLDLGTVENAEAHRDEQVLRLVERLVHRVTVSELDGVAGDGDVDCFGFQLRFHRLCLEGGLRFFELFLNCRADIVCRLTHDGALFCRELAHRLENAGQLALLAQKADAQRVQLVGIRRLGERV